MQLFLYIFIAGLQLVVAQNFATCSTQVNQVCRNCTAYAKCFRGYETVIETCPAATPFCRDVGKEISCVAESDQPGCTTTPLESSLQCTGPGFFPDPKNCSLYHYCKDDNSTSIIKSCRLNNVFNETSSMHYCRRKATTQDCTTVTCLSNTSGLVSYGTKPNRNFAVCLYDPSTKETQILMFLCDKGMVYNSQAKECVIDCKTDGQRQINPLVPNQYYECYRLTTSGPLVFDLNTCPSGTNFNEHENMCTEGLISARESKYEWILQDKMFGQ